LEWLRTFVVVVDSGSFTEAADRLGISQPAVSKHVQQLETYFAVELKFWRGRELKLTEAGQDVLNYARQTLRELERLKEDVGNQAALRRSTVVIASGPTLLYYYVPFLAETLQSAGPEVRLSTLTVVDQHELTEAVLDFRADIALHTGTYSNRGLRMMQVFEDQLVPVANPRHPFSRLASVSPGELASERILVLRQTAESRSLIDDWFGAKGLVLADPLEAGAHAEVRARLLATPNVGILMRLAIADDLAAGRLVELPVTGFQVSRPIYASSRTESTDAVELVLRLMSEAFRS
jgi:LysR family transcriptional regulator, low CO2-responsive transcriptional regulator